MDYAIWEEGQTGSIGAFSQYGSANDRILATDPWDNTVPVWRGLTPITLAGSGIYFNPTPIDNSVMYRMSWWEKRVTNSTATSCRYYAGLNGYGSVDGVLQRSNEANSTNPYFHVTDALPATPKLPLNEWILVVGHVWPVGSGAGLNHDWSGVFKQNGTKVSALSIGDFIWRPETTTARSRSLMIYSPDAAGVTHYTVYPRMDKCDGTEPSIVQLLEGYDSINFGLLTNNNDFNNIPLSIGSETKCYNIAEVGQSVRYIRDYLNGSTSNTANHWCEIQAYQSDINVALYKTVMAPGATTSPTDLDIGFLVDGVSHYTPYLQGVNSVIVDLEEVYEIDYLKIWHYWGDGRTYHNAKTEVSIDGITWNIVFDSSVTGEYAETSAGRTTILYNNKVSVGRNGIVYANEFQEVI